MHAAHIISARTVVFHIFCSAGSTRIYATESRNFENFMRVRTISYSCLYGHVLLQYCILLFIYLVNIHYDGFLLYIYIYIYGYTLYDKK